MKVFLAVVLLASALFIWQRHNQESVPAAPNGAASAQLTPRPASANNFAKRPLDRAHAVADEVRKTRESNAQP